MPSISLVSTRTACTMPDGNGCPPSNRWMKNELTLWIEPGIATGMAPVRNGRSLRGLSAEVASSEVYETCGGVMGSAAGGGTEGCDDSEAGLVRELTVVGCTERRENGRA